MAHVALSPIKIKIYNDFKNLKNDPYFGCFMIYSEVKRSKDIDKNCTYRQTR